MDNETKRIKIRQSLWATWETIASDLLQAIGEPEISRDEVIEVVQDAN